jgi:hypothetical protein
MSTDAIGHIEIVDARVMTRLAPRMPYQLPYEWARVSLTRDDVFFDLLAGGRSGDPRDAVVPVRNVRWDGAEADDPDSTWVTGADLAKVAVAYRAKTGVESVQARALAAMLRTLAGEDDEGVRLAVRFF